MIFAFGIHLISAAFLSNEVGPSHLRRVTRTKPATVGRAKGKRGTHSSPSLLDLS